MPDRQHTARHGKLRQWLADCLSQQEFSLQAASEDASFRCYYRVRFDDRSYIVMDAPPDREDSKPFVAVSRSFRSLGLNVPAVLEVDLQQGFLLLEDLGNTLYLDVLNKDTVDSLYGDAMSALLVLQASAPENKQLPDYSRTLLLNEMELFRDWLLQHHLGLELTPEQHGLLDESFEKLADMALGQVQVLVHRDYHSRNLMVTKKNNPGILDFQDAVIGPVTYDLVSLLRDCYIAWPEERVEDWVKGYHELAMQSEVLRDTDAEQFLLWFDWMGVQRHLKASGIFARLCHRDGKRGFLRDVPRTVGYMCDISARYKELAGLHGLLVDDVLPRLSQ